LDQSRSKRIGSDTTLAAPSHSAGYSNAHQGTQRRTRIRVRSECWWTVQKLHDDEGLAALFANVVNRADVGMVQCRRGFSFTPETLQSVAVLCHVFGQELQGVGNKERKGRSGAAPTLKPKRRRRDDERDYERNLDERQEKRLPMREIVCSATATGHGTSLAHSVIVDNGMNLGPNCFGVSDFRT
jgi:hypothetical protein